MMTNREFHATSCCPVCGYPYQPVKCKPRKKVASSLQLLLPYADNFSVHDDVSPTPHCNLDELVLLREAA